MQFLKLYLDLDYKCHTELDQKHINKVPHQCLLLVYVSRYSLPEEEVLWMSLLYIHVCTLCGWGYAKRGEVGILKNISGTSVTIDFPRNPGWGGKIDEVELCE